MEPVLARWNMVERQLAARGIRDHRVLQAMTDIPRDRFLAPEQAALAYDDAPVSIGFGQTISQPYMVAMMAELLELGSNDRVLEVGTGCGYAAAVYARLCAKVISLELIPELAARATATLLELGILNVTVVCADGTRGYQGGGLFDGIAVAAAAEEEPPALLAQLAVGGRMVMPVGPPDEQQLILSRRTAAGFNRRETGACRFVPLRSKRA